MTLELIALRYFKFERRLPFALRERSPRWGHGQPDILAVSKHRYLYEIEIKRSLSDFRRDALKASRRNRDLYPERQPKEFFYLVPRDLAEAVAAEAPDWAGVLTTPDPGEWAHVVRPAPVNRAAKRLSVKECITLFRLMSNYNLSLERIVNLNCRRDETGALLVDEKL